MDEIQSDLTCQICHSFYKHPKALPCIHSFCEGCLRDYVFSRGFDATGRFPCPLCRTDTPIPAEGISGYPNNHLLQSLIDTLRQSGSILDSIQISNTQTHSNGATINSSVNSNLNRPISANGLNSNGSIQTNPRPGSGNGGSGNCGIRNGRDMSHRGPPRMPSPPARPTSPPVLSVSNMGAYAAALDVPIKHDQYRAKVIFGKYGTGLAHFQQPIGLCFTNHYGETLLHVTDQRNTRVMAFKLQGNIHTIFTTEGKLHDITSDRINHLYVAVSNAPNKEALVLQYDLQGTPISKFGNMFSFIKPNGVALDKKFGRVIVTAVEEKQAFIFNKDGTLVQKFGKKGSGPDAFLTPYHVAVTSTSHIVISDCDSHCLKVFDRIGKSKGTVGQKGHKNGQLFQPRGIAIDHHDNIIVADAGNQRIQIFDATGKFVDVFLDKLGGDRSGFPPDADVRPRAIAVSGAWLAVLFIGREFAEVRVYEYDSPPSAIRSRDRPLSGVCVCQ